MRRRRPSARVGEGSVHAWPCLSSPLRLMRSAGAALNTPDRLHERTVQWIASFDP